MKIHWQLVPAADPGKWCLTLLSGADRVQLGLFDQSQLIQAAASLHTQAAVLRSTQCVLLQQSTMRISNE